MQQNTFRDGFYFCMRLRTMNNNLKVDLQNNATIDSDWTFVIGLQSD